MDIVNHFKARFPFVYTTTNEDKRLINEILTNSKNDVSVFSWDIVDGFLSFRKDGAFKKIDECKDPNEALLKVESGLINDNSIIVMKDYHKFFQDISIIRKTLNLRPYLKAANKTIVFSSPVETIPPELSQDMPILAFDLPSKEIIQNIVSIFISDNKLEATKEDIQSYVDALTGLSEENAEDALALSLVSDRKLNYKTIIRNKADILKAEGLVSYVDYKESFADLYGLELMKEWCLNTAKSPESNGILIYGVPGCGKSHFAKALANELKWACLTANFGAVRGKFQGEAETRINSMIKTIKAFGNCVVFADEFEKFLSGTQSGETDGGVGNRILQRILTCLADKELPNAYWVATCNSLDDILTISGGALVRRFDAIFFVDMPNLEECKQIAKIWNKKKGVEIPETYNFYGYTGADIAKLATTMSLLNCDVNKAREYIIPTSTSIGGMIQIIQERAKNVCIPASRKETITQTSRRVEL